MENINDGMRVSFILDNSERIVVANRVDHIDGWVVAYWNNAITAAMKDEFIKGFYLFKE